MQRLYCCLIIAALSSVGSLARAEVPEFAQGVVKTDQGLAVRGGVLAHDRGLFSNNKEPNQPSFNAEVLVPLPRAFDSVLAPRLSVGGTFAPRENSTSQIYTALNWDFQLPADFEFSFKLGAMVHNGEVSPGGFPDRKELGCRVLFHTGGGLGYRLENDVLLQFYMDHSSNGRICDTNEGLDNVGLRVGVPL